MTIQVANHETTARLAVTASGKLTAEDYETFEPAVAELIAQHGKIDVLFTMKDFHGWELGAVWEDIKFATRHCSDIRRIAMVGESEWEKWMATICKPFTKSTIRYFGADEGEQAIAWLDED